MKKISAVLILIVISLWSYSQEDTLQARLVLIGDAGDFKQGKHPVIDAVRKTIKPDNKTTILYLGDNLYKTGLPDEQESFYDIKRSVLDTQIAIANGTDAKVYFIPGNHDWNKGRKGGWEAIIREQQYIDVKGGKNVKLYPEDGCGGPVEIELSPDAVLIIFDSQWWIHPYDKPGIESDCPYKTKSEILNQIEDILSKNSKKLVVLACHHPFKSYGIHGGYFTLKQHIFPLTDLKPNLYIPLPVIGSVYPIARGVFGVPQDLSHPAYQNMIRDVQKVAKTHPNVIFVAGHEHNLQYIKDSSYNYIISGSGTKHTRVSPNKKAPFTSDLNGFAVLDISKHKNADVTFYTVGDSIRKAFNAHVLDFSKIPPPSLEDTIPVVYVPFSADSITVAANKNYAKASRAKRFFNGNNYRNVWATPVKLKVFRLNEEMGGFKITGIGGGHQTKSLKLKDKNGKEWSLRTINKDITKILPEGAQGTAAEDYLQDFISSAHPYSPVIVPTLAKAVKVVVATPKTYFVPNDPALGIYRPYFANSVCMLEEREPTPNGEDTKSEQKTVNKLFEDNDNHVDQNAFLRARLLDFLLADWDRHFDQWRFGEKDTGKGKLYYPIPRDRDQAFSYSDGILVKYASQNMIPFLKGFRKNIPDLKWLAYRAKIDLDPDSILPADIFLMEMLTGEPNFIRHYNHIGFQSYLVHPAMLETMDKLRFDCYRVGHVKERMEEMEPVIRNSDLYSFDISAIQHCHAPANRLTPNGFTGEEACMLMQYAGMSKNVNTIGLYGYLPQHDEHNLTAKQISHMLWYLMDGINKSKHEAKLEDRDSFNEFRLAFAEIETTFLQSKKTGRWWMEAPDGKMIACSHYDYIVASANNIPERWMRAAERSYR